VYKFRNPILRICRGGFTGVGGWIRLTAERICSSGAATSQSWTQRQEKRSQPIACECQWRMKKQKVAYKIVTVLHKPSTTQTFCSNASPARNSARADAENAR